MKHIHILLACIATVSLGIFFSSCSIERPEKEKEQTRIGVIAIDGIDHEVLEAGYIATDDHDMTRVQFVIKDADGPYGKSSVEIQIPTSLSEDWFTLSQVVPNWRILLQNVSVGNGTDMNQISEGKVLIKKLGEKDKDNYCEYRVAFEITLTTGPKAIADIQAKFTNSMLWAIL